MMRLVHAVLVGTIAVGVTGWPASVAYSTGQMTQKQAALQGLTVTRKTLPEATVDKLIVKLRTGKSQVQATAMTAARAQSLAKSAGIGMKSLRSMAGGAHLMQLDQPMTVAEARVVAARLSHGSGRRIRRAECPLQEARDAERAALHAMAVEPVRADVKLHRVNCGQRLHPGSDRCGRIEPAGSLGHDDGLERSDESQSSTPASSTTTT